VAGDGGVTDLEATDEFGAHLFDGGRLKVVREGVVGKFQSGLAKPPVVEVGFLPHSHLPPAQLKHVAGDFSIYGGPFG
jgi:hypothetical protein